MEFIVLALLYLLGLRRLSIWLTVGAFVNSYVFFLLGAMLFINYLLSGGKN